MTAGFLQLLQIDGSALPAIAGNTTRGTFWAPANLIAGWGSIVEFSLHLAGVIEASAERGGSRYLPQQVWRTLRVLRLRTDGNCP
jgi:hypothetical protein